MPTSDVVVLLRSRPQFGAQIVLFPALYRLKQLFSQHRLVAVARDPLQSVYGALPWLDAFVCASGYAEERATVGRHCAALVSLHPSSGSHRLLAGMSHPPVRLGYQGWGWLDRIWTHAAASRVDRYRGLDALALIDALEPADPLTVARDSIRALAATAPARQPGRPGRRITLLPGGGAGEFKKWGLQNYLALAARLRDALDEAVEVSLVLGPDEAQESDWLRQSLPDGVVVVRSPDLPVLAALIAHSDLVVANDCGPAHLAQCAGVRFLGVFDAVKPEWFWPRAGARCLVPPQGQPISAIALEDVLSAGLSLLNERLPA